MLTGVSVPSTPASAVPYSDAVSSHGDRDPMRAVTRSRHCSLNTSPANTNRTCRPAQSRPSAAPMSSTPLTKGGYPSRTTWSNIAPISRTTQRISATSLPGATTVIG